MLTPKEEVALALHLLKNWRQSKKIWVRPGGGVAHTKINHNLDIADHILELAKQFGLRDEFLDLLAEVPVMTITVEEDSKWSERLRRESMLPIEKPPTTKRSGKLRTKNNLSAKPGSSPALRKKLNASSKASPPQSNEKPTTGSQNSSPAA